MEFKTGNLILDTIIALLMTYLVKYIAENISDLAVYIRNYFSRNQRRIKSEYQIHGKVTISTEYCYHETFFPEEYRAVMFRLSQLGIDIHYGKQFNITNRFGQSIDLGDSGFCYSINTDSEIRITDDLYVRQINTSNKSNDLKSMMELYNLFVYSYTLGFKEIRDTILVWTREYNTYVKEYNDGKYYYFAYTGSHKRDNDNDINVNFESYIYESSKSFDNIFFEDKKMLYERIMYFLNNKEKYNKKGIPYTLGLLFHGEPGCGKTSCIKAIANLTKRHIVEVPLSKITTCDELKKIFFMDTINGYYVPNDKKMIILEDIDCMTDIVKKRDLVGNVKEISDEVLLKEKLIIKDDTILHDELVSKCLRQLKHKDTLTLSYLLNLIDGVLTQPGRIIIITSNYPEKLDEALIRPGRIDVQVEFRKCNDRVTNDILEFFFEIENKKYQYKSYIWTPAEIIEKCINIGDFDAVSEILITGKVITPSSSSTP